jgi:glycosyltransferase involved in cell wall biosynthesis
VTKPLSEYRALPAEHLVAELPTADGRDGWPWLADGAPQPAVPNNLRISVITPSYNQGSFIEETIRSVLLQGYTNLEYVVIDGGSTDDSAAIIERYAPFLDSWVTEPDDGQSDAINKGFERTSGDIVIWLNSDDRFQPGALNQIARTFTDHPDLVLAYGDPNIIDGDGRVIERQRLPSYDAAQVLEMSVILPQPAAFVRRSALVGRPLVRTDLHYTMDTELWFRLVRAGNMLHIDHVLADSRLWEDNKATAQRLRWPPELLQIVDEFFADPDLAPEYRRIERRVRGGVLANAGGFSYYGGDAAAARRLLMRSAWTYPPGLWRTRLGGRLVRALLGDRVFGLLHRLRRRIAAKSTGVDTVSKGSPRLPHR